MWTEFFHELAGRFMLTVIVLAAIGGAIALALINWVINHLRIGWV